MKKFNSLYRLSAKIQNQLFRRKNNSKWLLASIVLLLLLPILIQLYPDYRVILFQIALSLFVFTGIQLISNTLKHFVAGITIGVIAIFFIWLGAENSTGFFIKLARTLSASLFLLFLGYRLSTIIGRSKKITLNIIAAAVSGYFLIGLFGGQLCQLLNLIFPKSFTIIDNGYYLYGLTYYSFTTLTSLGFGDILPVSPPAQSVSLLIAIAGQLYLTILVAILVGKYLIQD
ncbi:hypothetical protein FK220_014235 [Flavobacteriaceae bacterium TP-CH-4]|uniref:Potassium channel domain-containing protein n=1 Tax=Pelagihabitans pacificus TaxID=2696054 RepID=A0A967E7C5_9FLAO|nr:ion channel [Pelagihabitans pacificus]NHF60510.1 hypothetical protein [Pelagihabitans pacificus]